MKRTWTVSREEAGSRCLGFYGEGVIPNPIEGSPAAEAVVVAEVRGEVRNIHDVDLRHIKILNLFCNASSGAVYL